MLFAIARPAVAELKRKSVVGGVAAVSAQGTRFVVQTATMMVLARLLSLEEFGLQGMVLMVTGFLGVAIQKHPHHSPSVVSRIILDNPALCYPLTRIAMVSAASRLAALSPVGQGDCQNLCGTGRWR